MVRDELNEEDFEIELERLIAKEKYDSMFGDVEDGKDDCSGVQVQQNLDDAADAQQTKPSHNPSKNTFETCNNLKDKREILNQLWEENSGRMVYNIDSKSFDYGNMQATSYAHNKDVYMPPPTEL